MLLNVLRNPTVNDLNDPLELFILSELDLFLQNDLPRQFADGKTCLQAQR